MLFALSVLCSKLDLEQYCVFHLRYIIYPHHIFLFNFSF